MTWTLDPETDRRERACRLGAGCLCTHTECRGGWLDAEETHTNHGQTYARVRRCPVCWSSGQGR